MSTHSEAEAGRFELLAAVAEVADGSLSLELTVQRLLEIVVPAFADLALLDAIGAGGELRRLGARADGPDSAELEAAVLRRRRVPDAPVGVAGAVSRGESQLLSPVTDEHLRAIASSDKDLELLQALNLHSSMFVPLRARGRILGALACGVGRSGRRYSAQDVRFAEVLAGRISLALDNAGLSQTVGELEQQLESTLANLAEAVLVENARLYTERSRIASTLQQSLLPEELPQIEGFELASLYRAAGEQSEVGGDFYDAFAIPGGWVILVGDVTGRGPEAAAITSLARYTMRTAGRLLDDPVAALDQLNIELRERSQPSFVTIGCALLYEAAEGPRADVILAGHPPLYHVRNGMPIQVGYFASPLGAYEAGGWHAETIALEPGDQLVLYADGVIDTVGEAGRLGEERLADALFGAEGATDAVRRIDQAIRDFAHGPQSDDTAVLVVQRVAAAALTHPEGKLLVEGAPPGS